MNGARAPMGLKRGRGKIMKGGFLICPFAAAVHCHCQRHGQWLRAVDEGEGERESQIRELGEFSIASWPLVSVFCFMFLSVSVCSLEEKCVVSVR